MWIADAARSREIDRLATEKYGIPSRVLMERAGLAVFDAVQDLLPDGGSIAVVCGRGNNGGDGFVVARIALEHGFDVYCAVAGREEDLTPEASEQLKVALAQGVSPVFCNDPRWERKADCLSMRDLIVDALLGTGAKGEVHGPVREAIEAINRSGVPVIAVDVPSGIQTDTGEELCESIWALRTVTFGLPKPFLFQGIGLEHSGYWTVAEIGFPHALLCEATGAKLLEGEWVGNMLPERLRGSHKGDNGNVIIVAGSATMPGAVTLAARAAIRAGVGLVTIAAIPSVCAAVTSNLPEAILMPLPERDGKIDPIASQIVVDQQHRFDAALFGPGLTHEDSILEFLSKTWEGWRVPSVIDADALNAVSKGIRLPEGDCVLTPHPGELSRLLDSTIAEIQSDRFRSVRQAVEQYRKAILLKGSYSIVGQPNQPMAVNCTGNPGMASGGMGDVLGGTIVTLLGQQLPTYYAACCGMFWHGLAGDTCAQEIGTIGYSASDVADALPRARAKITTSCCPR